MSQDKQSAEALTQFLKRVEDMARQRNFNIYAIVEDRNPNAKEKSGIVKLNLGMSRQIREAERAHKLFKKQQGTMKKGSYNDGAEVILGATGIPVS